MIIKRQKSFSKVFLATGSKDIKDLDDKQLENISKYGKSKSAKKNIRKNGIKAGISFSAMGGITGALIGGKKTAVKGATAGLGIGTGLALYGHHRGKKLAREAEELKRRKNIRS